MVRLAAVAVGLTALLTVPPASSSAAAAPRLSPEGFGPVHFGMNLHQADASLGIPIEVDPGTNVNGCSFWTLSGGVQAIAFGGRLGYISLSEPGPKTTRDIEVGDGLARLRHRYRGRLHDGRSGSLAGPEMRLFDTARLGGATYELEFDISGGKVALISAGTRHTIETFGECA